MTQISTKSAAKHAAPSTAKPKKGALAQADQAIVAADKAVVVEKTASLPAESQAFLDKYSTKITKLYVAGGVAVIGGAAALGASGGESNHAPTLSMSSSTATNVGQPVMVTLSAADVDGDKLTFTTTQGAHGAVTISDSSASYIPQAGFVGADSFTATVTDPSGASASQIVTVVVKDTAAPVFKSGDVATSIYENGSDKQIVYTAVAADATAVTYSLKAGGDAAAFSIDAKTGVVTLNAPADYETKPVYNFTVVASDTSNNTSEQAVKLNILNVAEGSNNVGSMSFNQIINGFNPASDHFTISASGLSAIDGAHGWPFGFTNQATFSTLITLNATGTAADGGDIYVWTGNNTVDTELEVDQLMSQMQYSNQYVYGTSIINNQTINRTNHASLILTDDGVNTYLWADAHTEAPEHPFPDTITLIATFVGVADCSTFSLNSFTIVA